METPLTPPLFFNYSYVLDFAARQCTGKTDSAILDYGCGIAQTVIAGRARGMNIYGIEVFQNRSDDRARMAPTGLLGTLVREIQEGVIDFPDEQFDFIFSNQVLEHVIDIDMVLKEIHRVLKPGGKALHLFPSKDTWREGHTGIPFLH